MIFSQTVTSGSFPSEWRKGNIVPSHKKNDKQNLINYRLVSLLPICGKISEILTFNWVRLNYATTDHHPPPSKTTHQHPPPAKIYPLPPTTSQNISTITYRFSKNVLRPQPCKSKNIFIYNLL